MPAKQRSILDPSIALPAIGEAFKKLSPTVMMRNPVMFIAEIGAVAVTAELFLPRHGEAFSFVLQIALWLWFTVLFANFAEAMAEGRGKAQAEELKKTRSTTMARKWLGRGKTEQVAASELRKGDVFLAAAGEVVAADGEIIEGAATVDES